MDDPAPTSFEFPPSLKRKMGGGYDRAETEALFAKAAASFESLSREHSQLEGKHSQLEEECAQLRSEVGRLRREIGELEGEVDRYQEDERLLGEALVDAKRSAAAIKDEARHEAETLVKKARTRAQRIVEKAVPEAEAKAREIISGAEHERDRLEEENAQLREFTDATRHELSSFLRAALDWQRRSGNGGADVLDREIADSLVASSPPEERHEANGVTGSKQAPPRRISLPRISSPS